MLDFQYGVRPENKRFELKDMHRGHVKDNVLNQLYAIVSQ